MYLLVSRILSNPTADEEVMERLRVLNDARALKHLAEAFAYPERPVDSSDPSAFGRNYFTRPSAPPQEKEEEQDAILQDLYSLKQVAVEYLHPELSVVTTDETAFGRNYFTRPSAPPQQQGVEYDLILQDLYSLKQLAVEYLHPEYAVVTTDETACARNFFSRTPYDTQEEAEERDRILTDSKTLRKLAFDYSHPELGVVTTDPCACGRSYFDRASSPQQVSLEDTNEFGRCMDDLLALKKYAMDYMHPERGVVTTDDTACGRNFHDRASFKGHDFISSSCQETFQIINHEDNCYLEECDLHDGNFVTDEEMVSGIKYQLHNLLEHCHAQLEHECVVNDKHEDEGKLSRSPSSVMLFGGYQTVA